MNGIHFPSAKVIIHHPDDRNQILLVQRNGYYEPAGGKVEIDFNAQISESLEECAIRETREELGLIVAIDRYVGSYYFFWSIDPRKYSSCAVFTVSIIAKDTTFAGNADSCELTIAPAWVSIDDVLDKNISIDPRYKGLEALLIGYCYKLRNS